MSKCWNLCTLGGIGSQWQPHKGCSFICLACAFPAAPFPFSIQLRLIHHGKGNTEGDRPR